MMSALPNSPRLAKVDPFLGLVQVARALFRRHVWSKKASAPKPGTPSCGETINWISKSPVSINITADSAVEFAAKIDQALGGNPHTSISVSFASDIDDGKMNAVNLTLEPSIIRPRWSGGRASETEKAFIKRLATFNKEHEELHRDISRAVLQKAVCDADPSNQEALDNKDGKRTSIKDASDAVTDFVAAGEAHNYHDPDCDPFRDRPALKGSAATREGVTT